MSKTCNYCGNDKESHEKSSISGKHRHVKYKGSSFSKTYGTATFIGECMKKARNDEKWSL